jgi:hypothetical protein
MAVPIQFWVVDDQRVQIGNAEVGCLQQPFEARRGDHGCRFEFGQQRVEAVGLEVGAQRHGHRPCLEDAVIGNHVFDAVFHQDNNPVTLLDASAGQKRGQAVRIRVDLPVGGTGLFVDDGHLVGESVG